MRQSAVVTRKGNMHPRRSLSGREGPTIGERNEEMDRRGCNSRNHRRRGRIRRGSGKQPGAPQEIQNDRDPPPGAENMNKRAERAQSAAPTNGSQGQKPADAQGQARDKSGQTE